MPGIKIPIRVSETDTGPGSYFTESADSGSLETKVDTVELNTNIETDAVRDPAFTSSEEGWKDRALHMHARASRMQAEMDGFRERQRRIAQDQVRSEQDRLLADVLLVADNLDRTLAASQEARRDVGAVSLVEGVALTRDEMMRVLSRYVKSSGLTGSGADPSHSCMPATSPS